jgi:simple sugar transport system substrate-binding protein
MIRHRRAAGLFAAAATVVLALGACSGSGGKRASEGGGGGAAAGVADTPRIKIAMITHEAPGDTFWTIVRKGAEDAAAKDNAQLIYSNDPEAGQQANLVQNAVDSGVDGIAVTLAKPDALAGAVKIAKDAGIPVVAFNSGLDQWRDLGTDMYFGQDENLAGRTAGERLSTEGAKKVLCVIQEQGQVALEARCAGVAEGFAGQTENIYVTGTDMPSVRSTIAAKLQQDPGVDRVLTLGAPFALTAVQSVGDSGSSAQVVTFDTNKELVGAVESGEVQWAVDQQPYLQGYLAVDSLWLNVTNGNVIGGGQTVLTGPSFIDKSNIADVAEFAAGGTR